MFYSVVFLVCFFIFSGTTESTKNKVFYISGYNTSNAQELNKTTVFYYYQNNEVLNLSCHKKGKPVLMLRWLHNGQTIRGSEDKTSENNLQFNITKKNDKDILECHAFEEDTALPKYEKKICKSLILVLKYIGPEGTTAPALERLDVKEKKSGENFFQKLSKSTLFWVVVAVFIAIIILASLLVCAIKISNRLKEEKIGMLPASSNTSVFTTESRIPILSHHNIEEENFYTNDTQTNKVGLNLAVSNASYFNTDSRKPITPHQKKSELHFYTNDTYNKTKLNNSFEVIDLEYQEPIDSQAYCEPQMYSEPEKQLYAEPIPKKLRTKKDTASLNYNKTNGSPNIKHEKNYLYQNCEESGDDEFIYYTETP